MKNIWSIARRDFRAYFTSPVAYIVIALMLLVSGFMFQNILASFVQRQMTYHGFGMGKTPSLGEGVIQPFYGSINTVFLFLFPMITMRLIAEERKNETLPLILTAPVTLLEFILGKFFSSVLFVAVILGLSLIYPAILFYYGNPEIGPVIGANLGTLLMCSCYLSMGLLFSSMTENQLVAGALTFAGSLMSWIINWASQSTDSTTGAVLDYLSLTSHYTSFSQGLINTSDVIFFLSFISVGLFLTYKVLESLRWR